MPTVHLRFSALPAHVRTARLVAATVARRSGVGDDLLDEVRLAVGEACSRAVGQHTRSGLNEPVTMRLLTEPGRFCVEVADVVPIGVPLPGITSAADLLDADPDDMDESLGLALISGLVDDVAVIPGIDGTVVRMTWAATAL
ncbi:ATP-binding protein [Sporichthya sp.]|uniref:ATP-binding protein n=1 Tax=Sporichthya sp. TaxID=65475 RepID=UPI00178F32B5|nr:ATP-binding protein [Sporichthya sp.]MBA3743992.1 ATP-binding protein [Sporichthya sp.]